MSNLNPDEIYEYQEEERNKPNGLFQVEEIEIIPVENGEEKPSENWYAITSKLDNVNECYPVKDKQTAEELCDQLNVLTMDLMFDKKQVCLFEQSEFQLNLCLSVNTLIKN